MSTDPHPDLTELDNRLGSRLDRVLEAEQEAAGLLARRSATMRERLLDAEDRGGVVAVRCLDGSCTEGVLAVVAADHLELRHADSVVLVAFDQISMVELR